MASQLGTSQGTLGDETTSPAPSRPRALSRTQPKASVADPVLRNALRYTISAREYESLHKYVLSRSRLVRRKVPSVNTVETYLGGGKDGAKGKGKQREDSSASNGGGGDTYNARAIRHALRVFIATGLGMKAYNVILGRIKGQKEYAVHLVYHNKMNTNINQLVISDEEGAIVQIIDTATIVISFHDSTPIPIAVPIPESSTRSVA